MALVLDCLNSTHPVPMPDYSAVTSLNRLSPTVLNGIKFTSLEIKTIFLTLQTLGLIEVRIKTNNPKEPELDYWDLTIENIGNHCFFAALTEKGILYLNNLIEESPLVARG